MTQELVIVGLCGGIGVGKDTVANILCENYGFVKESFASGLKDVVAAAFGWPRERIEGDTSENREWREKEDEWWSNRLERKITPRLMLQQWGQILLETNFVTISGLQTLRER